MTPASDLAAHIRSAIDREVRSFEPLAGGIICQPHKVVLDDGTIVFVKIRAGAPAGFFELEAAGLRWLGELTAAGGAATATVIAATPELLMLDWVEPTRPTVPAARAFGRALAVTHAAETTRFGTETDAFIGSQPLLSGNPGDDWPTFFAQARLTPYLGKALDAHAITPADATSVREVVQRLPELAGPAEPPARVHGDLWSGNVMWTATGVVLVDPAAHGGHREFDLAMLELFGLPFLDSVFAAYEASAAEIGRPLPHRWRARLPVHQLFPLLVHAVHFGGRYGPATGATARRVLALLDNRLRPPAP